MFENTVPLARRRDVRRAPRVDTGATTVALIHHVRFNDPLRNAVEYIKPAWAVGRAAWPTVALDPFASPARPEARAPRSEGPTISAPCKEDREGVPTVPQPAPLAGTERALKSAPRLAPRRRKASPSVVPVDLTKAKASGVRAKTKPPPAPTPFAEPVRLAPTDQVGPPVIPIVRPPLQLVAPRQRTSSQPRPPVDGPRRSLIARRRPLRPLRRARRRPPMTARHSPPLEADARPAPPHRKIEMA